MLRPIANPEAAVGHSYRELEKHFHLDTGDAIRVLEDLADFGVLNRALSNRVHLCPHCRRWTINFREACTACRSLDIDIEGMIHHFACAYVGLEGEFRHGADLLCPKCGKELRHIGLDYERPRQTYICRACERILEEPSVTTQCLGCGWEGMGGDVLPWAVFEYRLTARGHEAIERGELRGLKLREMIRTARFELASREFFELEVERETFRLRRYRRPMALLVCRFTRGGEPYELFRECDEDLLRALSGRLVAAVRSLDVAALADATAVAVLLPETGPSYEKKALRRIERELSSLNMVTRDGRPIEPTWTTNAWEKLDDGDDEPIRWFQHQLQSVHDGA